jgi:hypothetical protein
MSIIQVRARVLKPRQWHLESLLWIDLASMEIILCFSQALSLFSHYWSVEMEHFLRAFASFLSLIVFEYLPSIGFGSNCTLCLENASPFGKHISVCLVLFSFFLPCLFYICPFDIMVLFSFPTGD